jgi:nicotinate-nucleotide adenylyltransferase
VRPVSSAADRLALVQAAVGDAEGLEASALEIERGGTSFTADTLAALLAEDGSRELFLIVGSDAAAGLPTWERIDEVRRLATIVVATRPGSENGLPPADWDCQRIETPRLEVSSTDLRARIADGRPLDYLLTPPVIACIHDGGLYR